MHSPHQPLFSAIHRVQTLEKGDFTKVNGIGGLIKPKEISTLFLDLEYDTGKLHILTFQQYYYFPGAPKLLIFSSVPGPFLRSNEELGCYREVVVLFKSETVKFTCVLFQVYYKRASPLGIYDSPDAIYFCIFPFF